MSRHCSSVKSVGYDLSFIAPLPQNLTPTRRVNNSPDQMSRDNNCLKFSKPCNGHALKGLVKNWWASDTSLKDNAMEASDATNSFVRNHAGVSDQVRRDRAGRAFGDEFDQQFPAALVRSAVWRWRQSGGRLRRRQGFACLRIGSGDEGTSVRPAQARQAARSQGEVA